MILVSEEKYWGHYIFKESIFILSTDILGGKKKSLHFGYRPVTNQSVSQTMAST